MLSLPVRAGHSCRVLALTATPPYTIGFIGELSVRSLPDACALAHWKFITSHGDEDHTNPNSSSLAFNQIFRQGATP